MSSVIVLHSLGIFIFTGPLFEVHLCLCAAFVLLMSFDDYIKYVRFLEHALVLLPATALHLGAIYALPLALEPWSVNEVNAFITTAFWATSFFPLLLLVFPYFREWSYRRSFVLQRKNELLAERLQQLDKATAAEAAAAEAALGDGALADLSAQEREILTRWRVAWSAVTLGERLGSGATADVWKAWLAGKECACKILRRELLSSSDELLRFRGEILIGAQLRHAHLVQFIGAVWDMPRVCLIVELFPFGCLQRLLLTSSMELAWSDPLLRWCREIARAFVYLHGKRVIHRRVLVGVWHNEQSREKA